MADKTPSPMQQVRQFFKTGDPNRDSLRNFTAEWQQLSEDSKEQIREGIVSGSFTY